MGTRGCGAAVALPSLTEGRRFDPSQLPRWRYRMMDSLSHLGLHAWSRYVKELFSIARPSTSSRRLALGALMRAYAVRSRPHLAFTPWAELKKLLRPGSLTAGPKDPPPSARHLPPGPPVTRETGGPGLFRQLITSPPDGRGAGACASSLRRAPAPRSHIHRVSVSRITA